jgi:hypothetical protein
VTARYDKFGPVVVPPTASCAVGGSLVTILDPTISTLLAAFKSVLRTKLDDVWTAAAATMSSHVVEGTYPYEPVPEFAARGWLWPALFMWRVTERVFERTQVYDCVETSGRLLYVLPPLPYEHAVRLEPIRVGVRTVLVGYVEQHGDPEYASGASPVSVSSLESFAFTGGEYGFLEGVQRALMHPALTLTFEMRERQSFVDANYGVLSYITPTTIEIKSEDSTSASTDLITMEFDAT